MRTFQNQLVYHLHDSALEASIKRHVRGRLIDIGCGPKPYAKLLAPYVSEHVGLAHGGTLHPRSQVDLWGTVYEIPAPDVSSIARSAPRCWSTSKSQPYLVVAGER